MQCFWNGADLDEQAVRNLLAILSTSREEDEHVHLDYRYCGCTLGTVERMVHVQKWDVLFQEMMKTRHAVDGQNPA